MTDTSPQPNPGQPDSAAGRTRDLTHLAQALCKAGVPAERSEEMAAQLDRRAQQLAERQGRSYEEALAHLFSLMRQGWSTGHHGH